MRVRTTIEVRGVCECVVYKSELQGVLGVSVCVCVCVCISMCASRALTLD